MQCYSFTFTNFVDNTTIEAHNHQEVIIGPATYGKNSATRSIFSNEKVNQYQLKKLAHEYRIKEDSFSDNDDAGAYDTEDATLMMNTGRRSNVSKNLERKDGRDKDEIIDKGLPEMLCMMMKQQSAPVIDLYVFNGNPPLSLFYSSV